MPDLPVVLEPRLTVVREAFILIHRIPADWLRSRALRSLLPLLPLDLYPDARVVARAFSEPGARARALLGLAAMAPIEECSTLALEAVEAVRRLPNESDRAWVLSGALGFLSDETRAHIGHEALAACRHIAAPLERLRSLSQLPPEFFPQALSETRATVDPYARAEGLSALAKSAPAGLKTEVFAEALTAARSLGDPTLRARALASVAHAGPDSDRRIVMAEAWAAAQSSDSDEAGQFLLAYFAEGLPESLIPEALIFARHLIEPQRRAATLISLLPRLPDPFRTTMFPEILAVIQGIEDEWARGVALSRLAPHWPPETRAELARLANNITDSWAKASTLSDIAETLSGEAKTVALRDAVIAARSAPSPWAQVRALTDVAQQLPA